MKNSKLLILTDDTEFARLLASCWQTDPHPPVITVLGSSVWKSQDVDSYDLLVLGPLAANRARDVLSSLEGAAAVILCSPPGAAEIQLWRSRHPHLLHVPLREDWAQTLVLVAGESLKRVHADRQARNAISRAAQSESEATLGRYMVEMKHGVNNALTSILGNAELLLLEPGQLSAQSLHQIKTMRSMAMRLHEIMQRFSTIAAEIRDAENASQAETDGAVAGSLLRR